MSNGQDADGTVSTIRVVLQQLANTNLPYPPYETEAATT